MRECDLFTPVHNILDNIKEVEKRAESGPVKDCFIQMLSLAQRKNTMVVLSPVPSFQRERVEA